MHVLGARCPEGSVPGVQVPLLRGLWGECGDAVEGGKRKNGQPCWGCPEEADGVYLSEEARIDDYRHNQTDEHGGHV